MEILIVRHGQTVWNREKRLQGSTDIELNEQGRELAKITGTALKDVPIDVIYSSPLKRAYETACLMRGEQKAEIIVDDRLRELCFGESEGHVADELIHMPGCTFCYFFDAPEKYVPAKGGETFEELNQRGKEFMESVILPLEGKVDRVMIVAHGAVNKALMTFVKGHEIKDFWSGNLQRNCGFIIMELNDGVFTIKDEKKIFYNPDLYKNK